MRPHSYHDIFKNHLELLPTFKRLIRYLADHPEYRPRKKGRGGAIIDPNAEADKITLAQRFLKGRAELSIKTPSTHPDEAFKILYAALLKHHGCQINLEDALKAHALAMAAENLVGKLLERFVAEVLEPEGWIWCSGDIIRAVDFLLPMSSLSSEDTLLQIKNRDNSENSSSSSVRKGTSIKKWFRTFSGKSSEEQNWEAFPAVQPVVKSKLTEKKFLEYVKDWTARAILKSNR